MPNDCKCDFVLPFCTICTQFWLSVCYKTFLPMKLPEKESKANCITLSSLHVELITVLFSVHLLWKTFSFNY